MNGEAPCSRYARFYTCAKMCVSPCAFHDALASSLALSLSSVHDYSLDSHFVIAFRDVIGAGCMFCSTTKYSDLLTPSH